MAHRLAAGCLLLLLLVVRLRYQARALRDTASVQRLEGAANLAIRLVMALVLFGALGAWLSGARWFEWADMPLSGPLRWLGAPTGLAGILYLIATHRALGRNFSGNLQITDRQELVVSGPYRHVRHPMYTAFYLILIGFSLLSANLFLSVLMLGGLTWVVAGRVGREEAMMLARFGEPYREYLARTSRFLPRLSLRRAA